LSLFFFKKLEAVAQFKKVNKNLKFKHVTKGIRLAFVTKGLGHLLQKALVICYKRP